MQSGSPRCGRLSQPGKPRPWPICASACSAASFSNLSQDRSDLRGLATQELMQMAEDLAQDATLRVMDNLDNFPRRKPLYEHWANKIAIRLAISDLRRARYRDFSLDELTADGDLLPSSARLAAAATPTPEKVAERDDVMEKIGLALKEALTERQYQALVAVALKGIPMDVLAEAHGHQPQRALQAHPRRPPQAQNPPGSAGHLD